MKLLIRARKMVCQRKTFLRSRRRCSNRWPKSRSKSKRACMKISWRSSRRINQMNIFSQINLERFNQVLILNKTPKMINKWRVSNQFLWRSNQPPSRSRWIKNWAPTNMSRLWIKFHSPLLIQFHLLESWLVISSIYLSRLWMQAKRESHAVLMGFTSTIASRRGISHHNQAVEKTCLESKLVHSVTHWLVAWIKFLQVSERTFKNTWTKFWTLSSISWQTPMCQSSTGPASTTKFRSKYATRINWVRLSTHSMD